MAIKVKAVERKLKFTKNENDTGGSTAMCWALSSMSQRAWHRVM